MIFLDVHGVSIRVNSTDNFELFVKNTLPYFFVDVNNQSKPDICVDIDLGNETDHNSYLCKAKKIGRNAYIKDNFFYCTSGDYFDIFPMQHYILEKRELFGRNACRNTSSSYFEMITSL